MIAVDVALAIPLAAKGAGTPDRSDLWTGTDDTKVRLSVAGKADASIPPRDRPGAGVDGASRADCAGDGGCGVDTGGGVDRGCGVDAGGGGGRGNDGDRGHCSASGDARSASRLNLRISSSSDWKST